MRFLKSAIISITLALIVSACSTGGVQSGDKPQLTFEAFGSQKPVSLTDFKGKIVIVDFWATWCGPCMAEAGHMVAINDKYSPQGLQILGVSLDSDSGALAQVINEKHFTWPMAFDGRGWDGPIPQAWGVDSIPQTFIIGPDGDVLWRGHPAEMDAPLEKAFAEHPVQVQHS